MRECRNQNCCNNVEFFPFEGYDNELFHDVSSPKNILTHTLAFFIVFVILTATINPLSYSILWLVMKYDGKRLENTKRAGKEWDLAVQWQMLMLIVVAAFV